MRQQAKTLQGALETEKVTVTEAGGKISLTMDGNMKVTSFTVEADFLHPENKKRLEDGVRQAFENANKKIQRIMAMKVKEMGGLDQFKM